MQLKQTHTRSEETEPVRPVLVSRPKSSSESVTVTSLSFDSAGRLPCTELRNDEGGDDACDEGDDDTLFAPLFDEST